MKVVLPLTMCHLVPVVVHQQTQHCRLHRQLFPQHQQQHRVTMVTAVLTSLCALAVKNVYLPSRCATSEWIVLMAPMKTAVVSEL